MNAKAHTEGPLPSLPIATRDAEASKEIMRTLRHFHLGNPQARAKLDAVGDDCLPALLDPYRDSSRLRYDYPLFLHTLAEVSGEETDPARLAQPLSAWLTEVADGLGAVRMLKDNLPWIERELRRRLDGEEGPRPAKPLLAETADALLAHLGLKEGDSAKLREELDQLLGAVGDDGQLLGYERYPAIHLLIHTIRNVTAPRHSAFRAEVAERVRGLARLLEVEREKSAEALSPEKLNKSVGGFANRIDTAALSKVMDHSHGSVAMSAERKARIEGALATLRAFQADPVRVRILYRGELAGGWIDDVPGFEAVRVEDPCTESMAVFDREAARLAKVFAAARIARLEMSDIYDAEIHDPWFANFGWEVFSRDELLLVPAVIALEGADRMAGEAMPSFSRLLNSGRPVQIFVRVLAHNNPGRGSDEDPFQSYRTELGYLGVAHRKAFVAQTSAARSDNLLKGFIESLNATRTSLHLINTGLRTTGSATDLNAWLVAGAALEGRVHPFFRVNPGKGDSSAERVEFEGNPQPERDWPLHSFRYQDESGATIEGELPFTFADYCLLMENLRGHYALVPAECESDDLIHVGEFLARGEDGGEGVPFVWAVDRYGTLHRAVVSRALVHACCDRLNFWRTLQEMAGVKNRYVELALAAERGAIQAAADAEINAARAAHEEALAAARRDAAGEVMGRLTEVLMGMDFSAGAPRPALGGMGAATAAAPAPAAEAPVEEPVEEIAEAEEALLSDEAWIDTPLCTSCNDCLAVNPQVFVYNDENQAYLTNIEKATFAQLVEAAELCPSKCIHPGQPMNPNEPGLDELRLRAAAFH